MTWVQYGVTYLFHKKLSHLPIIWMCMHTHTSLESVSTITLVARYYMKPKTHYTLSYSNECCPPPSLTQSASNLWVISLFITFTCDTLCLGIRVMIVIGVTWIQTGSGVMIVSSALCMSSVAGLCHVSMVSAVIVIVHLWHNFRIECHARNCCILRFCYFCKYQ